MPEETFEDKLKEREAAIRQTWAAQSKSKKVDVVADFPSSVKAEMMHELSLLKKMSQEYVPTGVREMTEDDYSGLLERIKLAFVEHNVPDANIWLQLSSPLWWAVSLFLPYKGLVMKNVGNTIKKILIDDVGVDKNCIDFFNKNKSEEAYEWYFMPPELPKDICEAIAKAGDLQDQMSAANEIGWGIPIPNKAKDVGEIPLLVLNEELYRKIESGKKTMEYRNLVTYYCDKFFGSGKMVNAIRFQLGFTCKNGCELERMTWEVKDIMLASEHGKLAPAMTNGKMSTFKNLPRVFPPLAYAIKLGNRLPDDIAMCDIPDNNPSDAISVAPVDDETYQLIDGIKAGRLKSKSDDGYLVLAGEFYDAIESGKKTVEYRDFTKYMLNRTIGIKTIRFNRGTVKNAPQMKWEVKKVVLMDDEDNECDPFNVPEDFWPTTIAIHLGKRIG